MNRPSGENRVRSRLPSHVVVVVVVVVVVAPAAAADDPPLCARQHASEHVRV